MFQSNHNKAFALLALGELRGENDFTSVPKIAPFDSSAGADAVNSAEHPGVDVNELGWSESGRVCVCPRPSVRPSICLPVCEAPLLIFLSKSHRENTF